MIKKIFKNRKEPVNKNHYISIVNTYSYNKTIENNKNYVSDTFNFMIIDKSYIKEQMEQINLNAYITFIFNKKINGSYIIYNINIYI